MSGTEIVSRGLVSSLCAARDAALTEMAKAAGFFVQAFAASKQAEAFAFQAHGAQVASLRDRREDAACSALLVNLDADDLRRSIAAYEKRLDIRCWANLIQLSGMSNLMDKTEKEKLDKELLGDSLPAFTEENVMATFAELHKDANLIFQRGMARAFSELDRRFKSHDGFKIGSRVVLTHCFDQWGYFRSSSMGRTVADIERVFAVLDANLKGENNEEVVVDPFSLENAIRETRKNGFGARQSLTETPYFRCRGFQNGNLHLWFQRDDLVEKVNLILADYYGAVIPDGAPRGTTAEDLRSASGLPAKDLAFYPSPAAVVDACLSRVRINPGMKVLEPSAGTGSMVAGLLNAGAEVDAVEIDMDRVRALISIRRPGLRVYQQNFLNMTPHPIYDVVMMNPPFYGTHWMEHVLHAFDFLKPGGELVAVLPVSAEMGETAKHTTFREWARQHGPSWGDMFRDLPELSFASSGTKINTVTLLLRKKA